MKAKLILFALFCSALMGAAINAALYVKRPTLSKAEKERVKTTLGAYWASANTNPDPAFQGWWKATTRGDLGGFGFNALTDDIDVYIYIDTTGPLVTIGTLCGTCDYLRTCTPLDIDGSIECNHYFAPSPEELVHVLDRDGPLFDPTLKQSWWSLKLQADKKTLCASSDSQPFYQGYGTTSMLFQKVDSAPLLASSTIDFHDPVVMATYIRNALSLHYNQPQNSYLKDTDYLPAKEADALFQKMLHEGITFETKIRKVRVSQGGVHERQEFGEFQSSDLLTDIFTEEFSYATVGATVEISGFTGTWERLNGRYVNGVAIDEEGGIPNPSPRHIDTSAAYHPQKGTFRNIYNHFLLNFDSSDPQLFPRDKLGYALEVSGKPVVRVTHRFSSDMQYPAFFAAIRAMFFLLYKVSYHNAQVGYFKPGSMFLAESWDKLKELLATESYFPNNLIGTRTSQKVPSGFYNNAIFAERGVTTYNDPFGLNQVADGPFDYNIVLANYIVNPKNLYWAISGTPVGPYQFDPQCVGYKPAIPASGSAQFIGTLGALAVEDGTLQPDNPDSRYYTIFGVGAGQSDLRDANSYYLGQIDPKLTQGKKIGYLRLLDEEAMDPKGFLATSTFAPHVPLTEKFGREALTQMFANVTRYFQSELDADAIIIDIRSYNGGWGYSYTLAELFGDNRVAGDTLWTEKEKDNSPPLNFASSRFSFYNDVAAIDAASTSFFFVRQNELNYGPGAVFRGTQERPKVVVILTDNASCSAGDAFVHYFLGEKLDGNLGSYTSCKIIGDVDGRFKGAASFANPLVVPYIKFRADFACGEPFNGLTAIPFNQQPDLIAPAIAPSLRGQAGRAPLINDWEETVWPDLGLIKAPFGHFSPLIPKPKPRFSDRTTWRDCWLEQAILSAVMSL